MGNPATSAINSPNTIDMRFRLTYRGKLGANGNSKHKWALRAHFHRQLRELWTQEPLVNITKYIDPLYQPDECFLGVKRGERWFYPIVSEKIWTIAELDILLLRPGNPGSISVGGGDIDNRLKTLLDSLQVPHENDRVENCPLPESESDVFCLLQNDKLITRLAVEADRLLDGVSNRPDEVALVIAVHVLASSGRMCNLGIAV
ncbi:MAG: hypothetical protein ACR2OV_13740 [Hyphomicrobiaceae bacterium]